MTADVRATPQEENMADTVYESDAAPAADTPPGPPAAAKVQGTFALFDVPGGGLHLVYRTADEPDRDQHIPVPAFIVSMAQRAAAGGGLDAGMLGKLLGGAQ